ncbi:MAG TPA: DinB family protein [Saprospiraceae bacterium]|nr:DinB family protein [Saprospiraceae bacterium]
MSIRNHIISEVKRRIVDESIPRIRKCLSLLTENEIWYKHNDHVNSPGVLVLHLCGNVRQWILSGALGMPDERNRDAEFTSVQYPDRAKLIESLDILTKDLLVHLPDLQKCDLLQVRKVQCYEETILSILIHVTEHFSYHTGQIIYYTKWIKNVDTGFYAGQDLTRKDSNDSPD